ncbi:MAG: hypothetical protein Q4E88_02705 [Coriobacteriia bacterium]|nr:hypothetical protein [Coriobacteriia bacterium]
MGLFKKNKLKYGKKDAVYLQDQEYLVILEEYNYQIKGKKVFEIFGKALSSAYLPDTYYGKKIAFGSLILILDTKKIMYRSKSRWVEFGSAEVTPTLQNPVNELSGEDSNTFTLTQDGTEQRTIDTENYNVPVYNAVNAAAIYEEDAGDYEISVSYDSSLSGYDFDAYVNGVKQTDVTFDVDLHDEIELFVRQRAEASGEDDLEYGAIIKIQAEITPQPQITGGKASNNVEGEGHEEIDFEIDQTARTITLDASDKTSEEWYLDDLAADDETADFYLGSLSGETYNYEEYSNQQLNMTDSYKLMAVANGEQPSEDHYYAYDIAFITPENKGGK